MAPSEETEKECSNGDKIPETKITGTMNSDVNDVNSIIGASDEKQIKLVLSSSKSVPIFKNPSPTDPEESNYGSESELETITINETSLLYSQTYQASDVQNKNPPNPSQHKVQFVDLDSKRKYSDTQSCLGEEEVTGRNVKFYPQKYPKDQGGKSPSKKRSKNRKTSAASSVSLASVNSSSSTSTSYSVVAPDGGFGWVVVAASFFVNMIADGVTFSFGIMFEEFQDEFGSSSAATAGVVSMFHAVPLMTGPIATWLTDRYGCRSVTIVGAILAAIGFLAAAFSHHILLLYLFFGVVAGFGLSLCYVASIIIVAYYFDRRRSFATGISVCGSGIGTFLFAPFTQWLMDSYGGWRGACIILAGIFLNMVVCGMMFKELDWKKMKKMTRANSSRSLTSQMPEIDELRLALECGDVSLLLHQDVDEQKFASSLITIPTYIKDASKLPEDVLSQLVHNKKTYNYIMENFPESLMTESINNLQPQENNIDDSQSENQHEKGKTYMESTGIKLKKKMSSLLKGQRSILKKKEETVQLDLEVNDADKPLLEKLPVLIQEVGRENKAMADDRTQHLRNLKMRRQSMTYRKACLSTPRYHLKASSCPDIYKNTIEHDDTEEEGVAAELSHSMKNCCSLKYITLPFLVFCISNLSSTFGMMFLMSTLLSMQRIY